MRLEEEFEKETNKTPRQQNDMRPQFYKNIYVEWLEDKANKQKEKTRDKVAEILAEIERTRRIVQIVRNRR